MCANRSVTAAAKVRCYARHADLPRHLPALVTNLARPSAPHLDAVLTFMKGRLGWPALRRLSEPSNLLVAVDNITICWGC